MSPSNQTFGSNLKETTMNRNKLENEADKLLERNGIGSKGEIVHHKRYREFKGRQIDKEEKKRALIAERKNSKPSGPEQRIINWLEEKGIKYIREFHVDGLVSYRYEMPLFFDFYLPDYQIYIEYDGPHHDKRTTTLNDRQFRQQKSRDGKKNLYCKRMVLPLLRIPHWKEKQIEFLLNQCVENRKKKLAKYARLKIKDPNFKITSRFMKLQSKKHPCKRVYGEINLNQ